MKTLGSGRIVVVSPHLDDAVMSLGASIAKSVQSGAQVEVLTVFGYGPGSPAGAGPWDTKSGYRTEGEACRARRAEDDEACHLLGAIPRRLDFGAEPYERRGSPDEIRTAVEAAVAGADAVLIPGYPLSHPDHLELTQLLLAGRLPSRLGLYAEQPYLFWERRTTKAAMVPVGVAALLESPLAWTREPIELAGWRLKLRAVRCYRSQLRQLGMAHVGLWHMIWHEAGKGGEPIAWLPS